ncbi:MAG: UDP-N-acetylmuramoyl-L-alanine--D-glutamate ligase [Sphaerobacter sp.]|nr:UDP-N-acetylmuramoyl-L-alanine--D-glutamate ligase [Sphaerobacter sp.]
MTRAAERPDWRGVRALVMGLGTRQGGVGVARYLVAQGAEVTVTDLRSADELAPALAALAGLPIRFVLGEHRAADFEQADLVVRNPAVPRDSPWLALARAAGARIEMEMTLFFRACPAPIIGVTGTKGKTTTATLCAGILRVARPDTVLAGNMGTSALDALPHITPDTPVVLELSSWQLEGLAEHGLSPHIAVITNISDDHRNRYPSLAAYVEAKRAIARFQAPDDWLVLNRDDPQTWASRDVGAGRVVPVGHDADGPCGAFLVGDRLVWRWDGAETELLRRDEFPLPGPHAALNALAAAAAAILAGASPAEARAGLRAATPVPHRQEIVATVDGVCYVNDSAATAPAATLAALDTFRGRPLVLIAGGADKGADLAPLARRVAAEAEAVVLLDGAATPALHRLLQAAGARRISGPHRSMAAAVAAAAELAPPGGVVLLAPGCASFGLFRDEFERGEAFRAAVRARAARERREGTR